MNHTPLINSKRAMILTAIAVSCPFVQASTAGYISTSSAAGTSQVGPTAVYSGDTQNSINAREAARRKAKTSEALELLQQGRTCYSQKEYVQALEKYQAAWKEVPKAPATQKLQEFLVKSIGDASIAVAMEYARVGRYDEAEQLLLDVLERDPNNKRARHELALMRDPVRNNPALTPEHVKNVEEVNRLLTLAYGHLDLGNYDAAYDEFNRVIKIDPYNTAARRGQESISKRRANYYKAAHDSFRAKALAEVDAMWEEHLPQVQPTIHAESGEAVATSEGVLRNRDNLVNLKFDRVDWDNILMEDALDILRKKAMDNGMQMNFVFEKARAVEPAPVPVASDDEEEEEEEEGEEEEGDEEEEEAAAPAPAPVPQVIKPAMIEKLNLVNVTAADLLARMCSMADCEFRVEDTAVVISQKGAGPGNFTRRQWTVRPSFFSSGGGEEESDEEDDDFSSGGSRRAPRIDAKASLIEMGVNFPKGATAKYSPITQMLTVVNTDAELESVEEAINHFRQKMPKMVKVSAKFVEVTQTNEEELSFDWVINPFNVGGVAGSNTSYLGGVNAESSNPLRADNNFVGVPGRAATTSGLMTGGLRSGSGAITSGALTNLLNSGSAGAATTSQSAPGVMSLSGIYDRGSYQMIMRGLSQKKGVDVMSAPSLVISGDETPEYAPQPDQLAADQNPEDGCAKIEVIRRFVYPTEYDPPQIPNVSDDDDDNNTTRARTMPVAAPANPSSWGVEEVGVMLRFQIEPLKEGEGDIVRFKRFEIRVIDFEGFVNYGSPIQTVVQAPEADNIIGDTVNTVTGNSQAAPEPVVLTENRIDMPIFSRRYINSNPCVYDGHTIAIGGMIQDEVQKVEDKVPVFGDLPLIGRFFRSNAESHVRKNLMVFVTADVIDPFGKPLRNRDTGTSTPSASSSIPGLFPDDALVNP